jgi:peroxiredoxin
MARSRRTHPARPFGRSKTRRLIFEMTASKSHSAPVPPPLPAGLPVPVDDGAAADLTGREIPSVTLRSTDGTDVDIAEQAAGRLVLFVFPKIGRPDQPDPPGWDNIPGARGCTQENCAYRDLHHAFLDLGFAVAGLSAQPPNEQHEASGRLHLTFPLLADPEHRFGRPLALPTFEAAGMTLYKRLTIVVKRRRIIKVFYPVFPPQDNAEEVLAWIRSADEADSVHATGSTNGPRADDAAP